MRKLVVLSLFVIFISQSLALGQAAAPSPAGGPSLAYTVSPIRIVRMKASMYLYASRQVTYATIGTAIQDILRGLGEQMGSGRVHPTGGPVFVYDGMASNSTKPFTIKIGYPVTDDSRPVGRFQIGKLDSVPAATAVYSGSVADIGNAYSAIYAQLSADGHVLSPSGQRRERYLYWEGNDSPNNIVLIEIELRS